MAKQAKDSITWIIFTAFAFGTMEISLKIGGNDFSPLQLTFLRFFIGGLVLLPFALRNLKKRNYRLTTGDWLHLSILGLVNVCISMTLFQMGVMATDASLAAIYISANPVFTMVFAHFIVNERFSRHKAVVLLLGIAGLLFVADPFASGSANNKSGIVLVLIASIGFGFYSALGKKRIAAIGGLALNSFSFIIGSVLELVLILAADQSVLPAMNAGNIAIILYTGLVVTGFGYFCFMKAIEISGPSNASIAFFLKPVIAVILSAIILHEVITWNVIVGMLLIIGGCIYNLKKH